MFEVLGRMTEQSSSRPHKASTRAADHYEPWVPGKVWSTNGPKKIKLNTRRKQYGSRAVHLVLQERELLFSSISNVNGDKYQKAVEDIPHFPRRGWEVADCKSMDTEHDFSLGFHGGIDVTKAQRKEASLIKKHWIRQGKHGKG